MKNNEEAFCFLSDGTVKFLRRIIGKIHLDGTLELKEKFRTAETAKAVFTALHLQLHICGDYVPEGGWKLFHYAADDLRHLMPEAVDD